MDRRKAHIKPRIEKSYSGASVIKSGVYTCVAMMSCVLSPAAKILRSLCRPLHRPQFGGGGGTFRFAIIAVDEADLHLVEKLYVCSWS